LSGGPIGRTDVYANNRIQECEKAAPPVQISSSIECFGQRELPHLPFRPATNLKRSIVHWRTLQKAFGKSKV